MRLPSLGWRDVVKILKKRGFVLDRQSGSHMVFYHPKSQRIVVVPRHLSLKTGTLRAILSQAGITRDDLADLL